VQDLHRHEYLSPSSQAHLIHAALGYAQSGAHYQRKGVADERAETGDVVADHDAGDAADQNFTSNQETPAYRAIHGGADDAAWSLGILRKISRGQTLAFFGSHIELLLAENPPIGKLSAATEKL
jgi:hypothetical protein